jgi:hypothetical protein
VTMPLGSHQPETPRHTPVSTPVPAAAAAPAAVTESGPVGPGTDGPPGRRAPLAAAH